MNAPLPSPLSEHTVHVPPRQTCHVRAEHPHEAASIVLTDCSWSDKVLEERRSRYLHPRDALHLAVDPDHKLVPGKTSFDIESTKTAYVEIGNCSDTPLEVRFEIWGKP